MKEQNNKFMDDGFLVHRFHSHAWPELFEKQIANPDLFKNYKKITVVRNPWDTLVSWYWWGIHQRNDQNSWLTIFEDDRPEVVHHKFETFLNVISQHESIARKSEMVTTSPLFFIAEFNQKFICRIVSL